MSADEVSRILQETGTLKEQLSELGSDVLEIKAVLNGGANGMGLKARVTILWRLQFWLACTMSASVGALGVKALEWLSG